MVRSNFTRKFCMPDTGLRLRFTWQKTRVKPFVCISFRNFWRKGSTELDALMSGVWILRDLCRQGLERSAVRVVHVPPGRLH